MSLPREYRSAPYLPFSPPPQDTSLVGGSPVVRPRPSFGELQDSPAGAGFDSFDLGDERPAMTMAEGEAGPSRARTRHGVEIEEEEDVLEEDDFQLAKSYFDIHELDRVVHTLRAARGSRSRFLRNYAAYLSADRKA